MQRAGGAMRGPHWPAAAALVIALSGCHAIYGGHGTPAAPSPTAAVEAPAGGSGATVGTAAGGMAVAAVAGTLAGGYFGDRLGSRFDDSARQAAATAERQALANNAPAAWSDPQSGVSGRVRPLRSFTDIAGRRQRDTGIACRQSDGNWRLVGS